jgi:GNAT superfamily N-acetyltransferase
MPTMSVRFAEPSDVPEILAMIKELAEYEKEPDAVVATEDLLHVALFGDNPAVFALVAVVDGAAVGFALWFRNFSTWLGRHGIYLEDLYVRPEFRGRGIGKRLLVELARICEDRGYGRLEWWVLDWNTPAWDFYESVGAIPMSEWTVHRVTGDALRSLAQEDR